MKRFFVFFMILLLAFPTVGEPLIPTGTPFWKAKPKVYKRIREERDIIVSVKSVDDPSVAAEPKILRIEGGGLIHVPMDFAYRQAKDFEDLQKMSDHIRKVEWNEKTRTLFLHTEAFNYHARMTLLVTFQESAEKNAIQFKIIEGVFKGMEGRIDFLPGPAAKDSSASAEIGLAAGYRYNKFPIPAFFLHFGLEVVMQKIAGRMRSFIEEEYKRCHKKGC